MRISPALCAHERRCRGSLAPRVVPWQGGVACGAQELRRARRVSLPAARQRRRGSHALALAPAPSRPITPTPRLSWSSFAARRLGFRCISRRCGCCAHLGPVLAAASPAGSSRRPTHRPRAPRGGTFLPRLRCAGRYHAAHLVEGARCGTRCCRAEASRLVERTRVAPAGTFGRGAALVVAGHLLRRLRCLVFGECAEQQHL
jgi:hypothetical protein